MVDTNQYLPENCIPSSDFTCSFFDVMKDLYLHDKLSTLFIIIQGHFQANIISLSSFNIVLLLTKILAKTKRGQNIGLALLYFRIILTSCQRNKITVKRFLGNITTQITIFSASGEQ